MEACVDTFSSSVFGNGGEYGRSNSRQSPFNGFDTLCQNHHSQQSYHLQYAMANNNGNNGHLQQRPLQKSASSTTGMFPSNGEDCSYLQSNLQPMSWTDKGMSNGGGGVGSDNKMEASSSSNTPATVDHSGFNPYSNTISAAFNLQQLHQGICSVGTVPSWQQPFTFADCASTNVPSGNDEGNNETRIPMPLSMSSAPTSSSNHVLVQNGHCSSASINRIPNDGDNQQQQQQYLNSGQNGGPCFSINGTGHCPVSEAMTGNFKDPTSPYTNQPSSAGLSGQQRQDANGNTSFTELLSVNNNNGTTMSTPIAHNSSLPFVSSSVGPTVTESLSSENYVKLSTSARNVRLRTNTKLDMDRQKAQEEDRRDKELQKQQRVPLQSTAAVPMTAQPAVNVVVPSNVLQVKSRLENPTAFHVEQTRRFKIKQYCAGITSSLPDVQDTSSLGAQTVVPLRPPQHNRLQHLITDGTVSSAPPNYSTTPVSPISVVEPAVPSSPGLSQRSSVATSVNDEFEDSSILDLILTDEASGDHVASLPQTAFNRISGIPEGSSSCPVDSSKEGVPEGPVKLTKDRIKKDNHNKIERKRRFHINDMITEQSRLLPRASERHHEKIGEVKQNKGSILKASVDYTKVLKHDNETLHHKLQKSEQEKKELLLRLQKMEQICKENGFQLPENMVTWKTGSTPDDLPNLLSTGVRVKQEPEPLPYVADDFDRNICDIMDEDRSIVTGSDPMFSQVETDEGFHHPEGMDFND